MSGGIHETHAGACIGCLRGTDTALAFTGEAEWAAAGLIRLGVPAPEVMATISHYLDVEPGMVPDGRFTVFFKVCKRCADRAGFSVGLVMAGGDVPNVVQRESTL
jgi:hypothetical protein